MSAGGLWAEKGCAMGGGGASFGCFMAVSPISAILVHYEQRMCTDGGLVMLLAFLTPRHRGRVFSLLAAFRL